MMRNWGKAPHLVVMLNSLCFSAAFADEKPAELAGSAPAATATPAGGTDAARDALKQQASDASADKNLEQVFKATEKNYSLLKKGRFGMNYSGDYSYYRDSRIDIALDGNSSGITRFRVEEDAQHTFTNVLEMTYGLRDNLTLSANLPLVYKMDTQVDRQAIGLGDVSLGVRWQPIPLKMGLPTTTLFGSLSTATGDSPFEINTASDLSTGKGYYSLNTGVSVNKVTDPLVLFGSASMTMSNNVGQLNQARGSRVMVGVDPGETFGFSMGFAYSLNYDVSMSASFQQSLTTNNRFKFSNGDIVESASQVSALVNFSLSLRTSPKRIVNLSMGYGLTEDSPDVMLGFSLPIEFLGLATADQ
jgi:hypothetical protein